MMPFGFKSYLRCSLYQDLLQLFQPPTRGRRSYRIPLSRARFEPWRQPSDASFFDFLIIDRLLPPFVHTIALGRIYPGTLSVTDSMSATILRTVKTIRPISPAVVRPSISNGPRILLLKRSGVYSPFFLIPIYADWGRLGQHSKMTPNIMTQNAR